jgi:hypothetical protein
MKGIVVILLILSLPLVVGCAASREIRSKSTGERTDIFYEIRDQEALPKGFSELAVKAQIKTHVEGYYFLESKKSCHGKHIYPFLLNIDGQAVTWEVEGEKENTPVYYDNGTRTPDGGEGVRYIFKKRIGLQSGFHKVFFALPCDSIRQEAGITLEEGKSYVLEFKPHYNRDRWIAQNYLKGINYLELSFEETL